MTKLDAIHPCLSMPLTTPAPTENDDRLQALITFYNETLGFCPNSVITMYHRPEIAYAFIAMNQAVMANHGRVSSALKRFIGYISSLAAGCRYCQAHTIRAAERYGAEVTQLNEIWEFETSNAFSAAEKAALNLALKSSRVPNDCTSEDHARMNEHWNDGEVVEIVGVIALFGFLNRWNDTMATELEAPAAETGQTLLAHRGWKIGKHQ